LREINKQTPAPAVIVFTTNASPQMRAACLERGASYFFNKGHGFEPVEEALRQIALRPSVETAATSSPTTGQSQKPSDEEAHG
jgi:DNA-binding NarL/FixJ family response regulator